MPRLKAHELRKKPKSELDSTLANLKQELAQLRVQKVASGTASSLSKIRVVRRQIATVLTVFNQIQRQHLRKFYQGKKYKPLDLRVKKTRAIRQALTYDQKNKKVTRQQKRATHFPQRKFAVKP
eukprot:TRINITY_DN20186_c0_g1_i1.p1 TRINITY_DN20186_c0_g1~~TRINITY_DN20186_c0_g1_i1.p1  ORF type:complete len:124 (-),score=37.36 TRINITY_DN20186_c0_g1_i1:67-438(-)